MSRPTNLDQLFALQGRMFLDANRKGDLSQEIVQQGIKSGSDAGWALMRMIRDFGRRPVVREVVVDTRIPTMAHDKIECHVPSQPESFVVTKETVEIVYPETKWFKEYEVVAKGALHVDQRGPECFHNFCRKYKLLNASVLDAWADYPEIIPDNLGRSAPMFLATVLRFNGVLAIRIYAGGKREDTVTFPICLDYSQMVGIAKRAVACWR